MADADESIRAAAVEISDLRDEADDRDDDQAQGDEETLAPELALARERERRQPGRCASP